MSHVLLLGQMLCSGFSLHLRWPLLLLSFYKHLDTWDSFLSSFAVQPSISVFKLYLSHTSIQKKKKKGWHSDNSTALFHCWTDNRDLNCLWTEIPLLSPTPLRKTIFWGMHSCPTPSSDTAFSTLRVLRVQTPGSLEQEMVQKELSQRSFPSFIQLTHVGAGSTTLMQLPKSPST